MLLKREENAAYIYLYYDLKFISKEAAIKRFFNYTKTPDICIDYVRIDDGNSFHDGTESEVFNYPYDEDVVLSKCSSAIKTISFAAEYNEKPFSLILLFETLRIKVVCIKEYMIELKSLEQVLDLSHE